MRKLLLKLCLNAIAVLPLALVQVIGAFLGMLAYVGSKQYRSLFRPQYEAVIKSHQFPNQELIFNKGKNLYFAAYYVNPSDDRFMYVIHALKGREGYELYFLYCINTLTHHFEYTEGKDLYELVYDPKKNMSTVLTSFGSTLVRNP